MISRGLLWILIAGSAASSFAQVSFERILNAAKEPQN